jgi:large subunit ribosomal protein L21
MSARIRSSGWGWGGDADKEMPIEGLWGRADYRNQAVCACPLALRHPGDTAENGYNPRFGGNSFAETGCERCGAFTWVPARVPLRFRRPANFERIPMYAVIKTGGKQYRVAAGEKIKVEQIAADVGQEIVFSEVLAVGNGTELKVGTPLVSGASVTVKVVAHGRHDKVRIFKMRRRKHYQKRQGHRQNFTEIEIASISA